MHVIYQTEKRLDRLSSKSKEIIFHLRQYPFILHNIYKRLHLICPGLCIRSLERCCLDEGEGEGEV